MSSDLASPPRQEVQNGAVPLFRPSEVPEPLFRGSQRTQTLTGVEILACCSHLPERIVSNEELEETWGYEPGWIERRTGIRYRRYVDDGEATSDLACRAAEKAIAEAGVDPEEIDLLIVGTFTPDHSCPSTSCMVQERLDLDVPAFDLQAACSGFIYSLVTAMQYVATGNARLALVVGADTMSRVVNHRDQRTAPLFGDGAGAALISKGRADQGFLRYQLGADGRGRTILQIPSGGTKSPSTPMSICNGEDYLHMDGRSVFKWAVRVVEHSTNCVLDAAGMTPEDVDVFAFHQANERILEAARKQLDLPAEKVYRNLDQYGNTSAASIPIVLSELRESGRINRGDIVLMSGFGAGLSWGTGLFRW